MLRFPAIGILLLVRVLLNLITSFRVSRHSSRPVVGTTIKSWRPSTSRVIRKNVRCGFSFSPTVNRYALNLLSSRSPSCEQRSRSAHSYGWALDLIQQTTLLRNA